MVASMTEIALRKLAQVTGYLPSRGRCHPRSTGHLTRETGAGWTCPTHVDVVATRSTVIVDGQPLMREGSFLL